MARFEYSAYDDAGQKRKGSLEAESIELATEQLEKDGFLVTSIKEERQAALSFGSLSKKPKLADIEYFTSELALLLQSGLRIDRGINILLKNSANPRLVPILRRVSSKLKSGEQLSDALAAESAFDELYISLIKVGEESGELVNIFQRLAADLKERRELQNIIKQALVYPTVILFVCIASVLFIFNYVVPNLTGLFSDSQQLPWYTTALLSVSDWIQTYQIYVGIAITLVVLAVTQYKDHPSVDKTLQWIKDNIAGINKLTLLAERARFASSLSVMLNSGLSLDRAVKLGVNIVQQQSLRQQLSNAHQQLKKGSAFSQAFGGTSLFTDYYRSLVVVGEESGEMGRVFSEIADRSRAELNQWVKKFTTLLEPLMILTMGAIVGTVVVVMMLSINAITDVQI